MKKIFCVVLALTFLFSVNVFASSDEPIVEDIFSRDDYLITDTSVIDGHETVTFSSNENLRDARNLKSGDLISTTITSVKPTEEDTISSNSSEEIVEDIESKFFTTWSIKNWTKGGSNYYYNNDYTQYRVDGPSNYSLSISTTGYYKLSTEVTAKVEGLLEAKVGAEIGSSKEITGVYTVDVPSGCYIILKVYPYYTKYNCDIYKNNSYSSSVSVYEPTNGYRVVQRLYKK